MVKYYANIRICLYLCSIWLTFIRFLQPDEHNNMMHRFIYTILILVAGLAYTSCDPLEQNRPDNNQEHETTDPDTGTPDGNDKEVYLEDVPLDAASLMACGSSIGTGGMIVFDDSVEMIQALANLNAFYKHESCGQCTPCREGSIWMSRITKRICDGNGTEEDIDTLKDVADNICGRTICAHGEGEA